MRLTTHEKCEESRNSDVSFNSAVCLRIQADAVDAVGRPSEVDCLLSLGSAYPLPGPALLLSTLSKLRIYTISPNLSNRLHPAHGSD
jgi:hypothetical protein